MGPRSYAGCANRFVSSLNKAKVFYFCLQIGLKRREQTLKQHLLQACRRLIQRNVTDVLKGTSKKSVAMRISAKFKLAACKLEKVGSTNIARVFYLLEHMSGVNISDANTIAGARARNRVPIGKYKNTTVFESDDYGLYTKFMFVRDPLERLLSAYRDRHPHGFFKNKKDPSFKSFLENILNTPDMKLNPHVASFNRKCRPCEIKYDFVGLLDNFETEMKNILRSVGVEQAIILPKRNQTGYEEKSSDVLRRYLQSVPKTTIKKIYQRYYFDYFLFGFKKPDF